MNTRIFLALWLSVFSCTLSAQEQGSDTTKQLFVVTKHDGVQYIGLILSDDGREVLLETEMLGKIYIPKQEIRSIVAVENTDTIVNGEYRGTGPFTTRYVFTTNALPIRKGENYAMINLYGPEVHFAVADNFNLGVMSTWGASPLMLATKYSFKTKKETVNFSIGTLIGTSGYLNIFRGYAGLHFANVTIGNRQSNITLSAGYGYFATGSRVTWVEEGTYYSENPYSYYPQGTRADPMYRGPVLSIGGIAPVGAKASFVFDSMFGFFSTLVNRVTTTEITPPDYQTIPVTPGYYRHDAVDETEQAFAFMIMPGMRFQSKENRAFQFALSGITVFEKSSVGLKHLISFPVPMCTWFFRF
jgi:hypothetical protein